MAQPSRAREDDSTDFFPANQCPPPTFTYQTFEVPWICQINFTPTDTPFIGAGIGARYSHHAAHGDQSDSKRTQAEYPICESTTTCDRISKSLVGPSPLLLKENLAVKLRLPLPEVLTLFAKQ